MEILVNYFFFFIYSDGKKMSKSLKNYPDPMFIINAYGADALRFGFKKPVYIKFTYIDILCFIMKVISY